MTNITIGIVGTGLIAGVIARSLQQTKLCTLHAVSSRTLARAEAFTSDFDNVIAVEGIDALLSLDSLDAVYIATPTATKEALGLQILDAGKHVLIDKPFASSESLARLAQKAKEKGLVLMDATHFVHHPRTAAIQESLKKHIGGPRSLHTAFYFPFADRDNIRFDPTLEPMTALGDMAWYSARAITEYLQPTGAPISAKTFAEYDRKSGAITRASGILAFEDGKTSSFDVGYTAGTLIMDLQLLGTTGMISMDDFVMNWTNSATAQQEAVPTGYIHRSGMASRDEFTFVETPSSSAQDVVMMDRFASCCINAAEDEATKFLNSTVITQGYLDAMWNALQG